MYNYAHTKNKYSKPILFPHSSLFIPRTIIRKKRRNRHVPQPQLLYSSQLFAMQKADITTRPTALSIAS
jgi:hypothetical protein